MSKQRNPNDLIRIEDAIKVLCRKTCHPGVACPDIYCKEMWDEFENVKRVDAVPVVRCKGCEHREFYGPYLFCERHRMSVDADYFCGDGIREDGNND